MKHVLITGGSRGIGASTAIECARRGFGVILTWNNQAESAQSVVKSIEASGGKAIAMKLNVGDAGSFDEFRTALERVMKAQWNTTGLDGLVNNAGYGLFNPIEAVTEEQFNGLMNVHLKGPFFLTQKLLPLLRRDSCIVNITSATTRVATAGVAPYAAFKGGLKSLVAIWRRNLANAGLE